jgi:hypothetical protein
MRIMMLYKPGREETAPPTPENIAAMGEFIGQMIGEGVLIDTGGLQHSSTGARVSLSDGELTVTDGPFTEAKELIGGYAIVEAKSMLHAIDLARRFLEVAGGGISEIRPMCEAPPAAELHEAAS